MTDIPIGWALRDDLVGQVVSRTRACGDAEPRSDCFKPVHSSAEIPIDTIADLPITTTINASIDKRLPVGETASRSWPIARTGNATAFETVNEDWESMGALSREFPNGEIRRSPGVRGVRIIEIN
jgi:hypothetical protein